MARLVRLGSLLMLMLAACGGGTQPDPCADAPTFTRDIFPIVQSRCITCHSATLTGMERMGAPAGFDFDTYESTQPKIAEFADAITSGREPPPEAMNATTELERTTARRWRACEFPK